MRDKMAEIRKIKILSHDLIGKIAAGEVVERPSSVIKELVENAIDAGSTRIKIHIANGGKSLIRVSDNGTGMAHEDAKLAFERHATSKIKDENELYSIETLGFRGEALPSIGAVSKVELTTRQPTDEMGVIIKYEGGKLIYSKPAGASIGTVVTVTDLFYNVPARHKYLKTSIAEGRSCTYIINNLALAHPEIAFQYTRDDKEQFSTAGDDNILHAIASVYGPSMAGNMLELHYSSNNLRIKGYISKPEDARKSRNYQSFFVNGRYFNSSLIRAALENGFKEKIPRGRFPTAVIYVKIDPSKCDVNVHPGKMEIKFEDESALFKSVLYAVKSTLATASPFNTQYSTEEKTKDNTEEGAYTAKNHYDSGANLGANIKKDRQMQGPDNTWGNEYEDMAWNKKGFPHNKSYNSSLNQLNEGDINYSANDEIKGSNNKSEGLSSKKDKPALSDGSKINSERYTVIGQVHDTYIIVETGDGMLLIDQHAAHERIIYDSLWPKDMMGDSQGLLIPITIELDSKAYNLLEDKIHIFTDLGFDMEIFGSNTFIIRAVPGILKDINVKSMITDIVDEMDEIKRDTPLFIKKLNCIMACKSAIKAGQRLSQDEMKTLVSKLFSTGDKYTCPHGRPAAIKVSLKELHKKFARI